MQQVERDWLTAEDLYGREALADALTYYENVNTACAALQEDDQKRRVALKTRSLGKR